ADYLATLGQGGGGGRQQAVLELQLPAGRQCLGLEAGAVVGFAAEENDAHGVSLEPVRDRRSRWTGGREGAVYGRAPCSGSFPGAGGFFGQAGDGGVQFVEGGLGARVVLLEQGLAALAGGAQ